MSKKIAQPLHPGTKPPRIEETKILEFSRDIKWNIELRRAGFFSKVRYPTDAEWIDRQRHVKVVSDPSGGMELRDLERADLTIFEAIYISGDSPKTNKEFDEFAATIVIQKISAATAEQPELSAGGSSVIVELKVVGGFITTHELSLPTLKELNKFRKVAHGSSPGRRGDRILSTNLFKIGDFYDANFVSISGYAGSGVPGDVPINHKLAIITELEQWWDEMEEEEATPDFS